MTVYVYGLVDPRIRFGAFDAQRVRYIGQTNNLARRARAHKYDPADHHKARWVRKLKRLGLEPRMVVIETCATDAEANAQEVFWIARWRELFGRAFLTNSTDGDSGVRGHSPSPATRAKLSAVNKGRVFSSETLAKMSAAQRGRKPSDETKQKHSVQSKAVWARPEFKAKMSAAHAGRPGIPHTAESRAKMSAAGRQDTCHMGHDLGVFRRFHGHSTYCKECRRVKAAARRQAAREVSL